MEGDPNVFDYPKPRAFSGLTASCYVCGTELPLEWSYGIFFHNPKAHYEVYYMFSFNYYCSWNCANHSIKKYTYNNFSNGFVYWIKFRFH